MRRGIVASGYNAPIAGGLVATLKMSGATFNQPSGTASWSTASATFAPGSLVVVMLGIVDNNDVSARSSLTCAGGGLTYTVAGTTAAPPVTFKAAGRMWTAPFAAGGSLALTFDCGAISIYSSGWMAWQVTGWDTTGGSFASLLNTGADGALSGTLSAAPASGDITLASVFVDGDTTGTVGVTPGAGFTEDGEAGSASSQCYVQGQQRTGSTSTNVPWVDIRTGTMPTYSASYFGLVVKVPVAAVTEPPWLNMSSGVAARNGTTTHTIPLGWTAGTGTFLVFIIGGGVTHSNAGGWTERQQPVNSGELSIFTKAGAGETSITITHNASNYPCEWVAYEFKSGTTYVNSSGQTGSSDTWAALGSLPGTPVVVIAAWERTTFSGSPTLATTWSAPWVEDRDHVTVAGPTDGIGLTAAHQIKYTGTTITPAVSPVYTNMVGDAQTVAIALSVPP